MASQLEQYEEVVGREVMQELPVVARHLAKKRIRNINSTPVAGGVAELLTRIVPLLRGLGVETTWDVIKGDQTFFNTTKAFHNALHGKRMDITEHTLDSYRAATEMNLRDMNFRGDVIWIHAPQPAGLFAAGNKVGGRWVWRCHIDVSTPDRRVWKFLQPYVEQYDAGIFSMPDFAQQLPIPQYMMAPSIDPLRDKNRELDENQIDPVAYRFHLDRGRPILTQISRFDRLKDPLGVIAANRLVKARRDCQLVPAGGGAPDHPEGFEVLQEVQAAAADDPDIHVLLLPDGSDIDINARVRASTVVFQKSIKEGFGLTVAEALWKRRPVIGGAVGGIRLQALDGVTGYLVHPPEGAALRALQLLADADLRRRMGENGCQNVKQKFLLTRDVKDHLLVVLALEHPDEDVVHAD